MKLWSKEALVLGGIYSVLDMPLLILNLDTIREILFVLFIAFANMLCFNKTPVFISYIIKHYPAISYYLCSFGWIIYFIIIAMIGIIPLAALFEWKDTTFENMMKIYSFICSWGVPVSILTAFLRTKLKKP